MTPMLVSFFFVAAHRSKTAFSSILEIRTTFTTMLASRNAKEARISRSLTRFVPSVRKSTSHSIATIVVSTAPLPSDYVGMDVLEKSRLPLSNRDSKTADCKPTIVLPPTVFALSNALATTPSILPRPLMLLLASLLLQRLFSQAPTVSILISALFLSLN